MYLSIFTDELKIPDTAQTLATLAGWGYEYVDFRGLVFGKAIDSLDQNELAELKQMLAKHNLKVGCLQSSLAKVHLPDQERRAVEAQKLEGLIRAADALDCRLIRAFNYWQPQHAAPELHDQLQHRDDMMQQVLDAFEPLAKRAKQAGLVLGFENCGQSPREVLALLDALNEPTWALAWDCHDDWNSQCRKDDEVEYMIELAQRCNMVHVKAKSVIPQIMNAFVPWDRVLATCAAAGLKGPVSIETHYPGTVPDMDDVQASKACYDHIKKCWPSAAPGDIREAAKPDMIDVQRDWADNPVRFVMVGLGMGRHRAKGLVKTPGCKLVGVCDLKEDMARQVGAEFDVPWTTDVTSWLSNDDVDVIFVVTPTGNHGKVAMQAMRAGKHVITTKPMDATLAACYEMIQVAQENKVLLAVDFEKRFDEEARQFTQAVKDEVFGHVYFASAHLRIKREEDYFAVNGRWHGTWEMDGGGTFSNQCIHLIDELICALGMPKEVRSSLHTLKHNIEAEDFGLGEWRYANGTVVRVFSTTVWLGSGWDSQFELSGEKGCYVNSHGGPLEAGTRWFIDEKWSAQSPVTVEKTWVNSADNMAAAIRSGAALACDGHSGLLSRVLLEGMYESALHHDGGWVDVSQIMERAKMVLQA